MRPSRVHVLAVTVCACVVEIAQAYCPAGDLDGNCRVDFADVAVLADRWLKPPDSPADIDGDDSVNMDDLALLAENWRKVGVPLVINEVMASNNNSVQDPQGQYDDWIEIYNAGSQPINIGGMYLTDDPDVPTKWRVPTNNATLTTINSKGYLLIWADNDTADSGLHANFRLDAGGDQVALYDKDGVTLIDTIEFGDQMTDVSYGRTTDAADSWVLMGWPTAGTMNVVVYQGFAAKPRFSYERGFYTQPFTVTLSSQTESAAIYYTLNGSAPYDMKYSRPTGLLYTGPIAITSTTCLRAAAAKSAWKPSAIDTHTYIFPADVIRQPNNPAGFPANWGSRTADYAMDQRVVNDPAYSSEIKDDLKSTPSVCIVIPNADFFGSGGIYANATATGDLWERAASVEWIDPSTGDHFGVNAGLRIHGGPYGRSGSPKNALRVVFRAEYGQSRLEHPLFPDTEVRTFNTLALRSIWNYSWTGHSGMSGPGNADYLRDVFARDTVRDMGRLTPHGRPVQVYINGLYWGLYIMTERPDEHFVADHLGGDREDYDMLEAPSGMGASTVMEIISGGEQARQAWNTLFTMAASSLASSQAYEAIQAHVDIPTMIDYMLMVYYTGSRDAPVFLGDSYTPRNFYAVRHREPPGPFVLVPWDTEWALEEPTVNRVGVVGVLNPHYLMDRLAANFDFKMLLADHIHRRFHNGGALTRESTTQRYKARAGEIYGAIVGESARWGDEPRPSQPYTRKDWENEVNRLVNQYFSGRTETVLNQLRTKGWYPSVEAPTFYINGQYQHGGHISASDRLSITAAANTIYYTLDGSDPRVPGTTSQQTTATLVAENAAERVLVPTAAISDAWRGGQPFDDSGWISGVGGVGYETTTGYEMYFGINVQWQMYNKNATCYIRIPFMVSDAQLATTRRLTLRVRYDDGFIAYINGTEVQRVLFTGTPGWNSQASGTHDDSAAIAFENFDLSNYINVLHQGTNILAVHGLNSPASSSDFLMSVELLADQGTTPANPQGVSSTAIEYKAPITLTKSTHVKSRVLSGTTWSALNEAVFAVGPVAENLRITEIMYHPLDTGNPSDPNAEYVELKNIGTQTINLNLVKFTKGIDFTFGDIDLAPNKYILVVKDLNAFTSKYGQGLPIAGIYTGSLDNAGEKIELQDAAGKLIHSFKYADNWYEIADGMGFSITVKDPANIPAEPNSLSDKSLWRPSASIGGSPGIDDTGSIPELGDIVINEIMAHSHAAGADWIELYNTTNKTINIAGWFLSDDQDNLTKYQIAQGTVIGPYGYKVFYEHETFNNLADPGCKVPFALSENGEMLCLQSGFNGVLTGYSEQEKFDASETGVSMGRYLKSTGAYNFVALQTPTPNSANSYPKVGPVVINEIMYHPDVIDDAEYVELLNISSGAVRLYDDVVGEPWRFTDDPDNPGIDFRFPKDSPVTLNAGEYLLLVKDLTLFSSKYTVPQGVKVYSWGGGKLDNAGEKTQLSKPGDLDAQGTRYWIRVDRIVYSDGTHPDNETGAVDPWPVDADGLGKSLSRKYPDRYGNDPNNWQATTPSPGRAN